MCVLFLSFLPKAQAQAGTFDVSMGFGTAQAKESSTGISTTSLTSCSLSNDLSCVKTPDLSSFMMGFDGTVMVFHKLGVGAEVNFQPRKQDYITLADTKTAGYSDKIQSRMTFYDFNTVYRPVTSKTALLQLTGGIGGVNIRYYEQYSGGDTLIGSSDSNQKIGSVNKFQLHGGVGVQFYVNGGLYIRPQFDLHYVPNLDRYGTDLIKRGSISVGYTFGK
jgi:hypothetical protein